MASKTAKRVVRLKYASDDETVLSDGGESVGAKDSQKESEKTVIPQGGEVNLQGSNIRPKSLSVKELKTGTEFSAVEEDRALGPGKYFFLPEDGTLFFDPSDAGRRVQIEYLWSEDASSDEEEDEEESSDEEDSLLDDEDEGEEKKKKRSKDDGKPDDMWHLDSEWFKWKPLTKKITVNNALQAKLDKGVDLRRGIKVFNEKTNKELPVSLSGGDKAGNPKRQPHPGTVVYNYDNGHLYWGDQSASGNSYVVEYYMRGEQGEKVTLLGEENEEKEYQLVESFKNRAENLWTNLLDNPDPEFVRETLLPVIEEEIESLRSKVSNQKNEAEKANDLKRVPDLTGQFMELEQLLAKREADDNEDNRAQARTYIETDIAPHLARFYALASLLAEKVYGMQSSTEEDEDFPEFGGSGARTLDLSTLKYLKKVRQEANKIDEDLVDFSKYYTGLIVSWIRDPETYFPGKPSSAKKTDKKTDPRWEKVRRVFEESGISLADLQVVALEAFRRAILEFDRDNRDKKEIPDPKKFRVYGNPLIKRRVTNALKRVFDKYQTEQQVEISTKAGSTKITIPKEGGEVDLKVPGLRLADLEIVGSNGTHFTSAAGVLLTPEPEKRKGRLLQIVLGKRHKDAQISVTNPETGQKLKRVTGHWGDAQKALIASDPSSFQFSTSSGTIWVSDAYRGKKLLVEAPNLSGGSNAVGKNQYKPHPTRGTVEFSSQNGGEEVQINFTQTVRAKRMVDPTPKTTEDSYTGDQEATRFTEMVEDNQDSDPAAKEEAARSQERVDKLMGVIQDILSGEDPRLNNESKAILNGLLGLGDDGQRLSIQEIAAKPPFNYDPSDSSKVNQVKVKRQKAADLLMEILKEKAETDPSLKKLMTPMESILMGDRTQSVDTDKLLKFLLQSGDSAKAFQNVLVGVLGKVKLKQDEENILRWMWALPGSLRREASDDEDEGSKLDTLPSGLGPAEDPGARLQEIAIDEFGVEADDDGNISHASTTIVGNVYRKALKKFEAAFDKVYTARKDYFKEKFPEFVQYYDRQLGKQNLRDELNAIEQPASLKPKPKATEKGPPKTETLFDQIKKSLPRVEEPVLRSLMEELLSAHNKGKSIQDLLDVRQKDIDTATAKGAALLEKTTKESRARLDALRKAIKATQSNLDNVQKELKSVHKKRTTLRDRALASADEKTRAAMADKLKEVRLMSEILAAIKGDTVHDLLSPKSIKSLKDQKEKDLFETFSYLRDADGQDLKDATEDLAAEIAEKKSELEALRKQTVALAGPEIRKSLRQLKEQNEKLKSDEAEFNKLLGDQQAEEKAGKEELQSKLVPLQKKVQEHLKNHNSLKELQILQKVQSFFGDRDYLQRGDGSYTLDNMFEVQKPEKGKAYKAPKFAPGEEDTYQPSSREQTLEGPVVKNKPSGTPDAPSDAMRPRKAPKNQTAQDPEDTAQSLFDRMRSALLPLPLLDPDDPEENPEEVMKEHEAQVKNFKALMTALQAHFAKGESLQSFKATQNQTKILQAVADYLRRKAGNLQKGRNVWDLSGLFSSSAKAPEKTPSSETQRSLFDELRDAAISPDPEESRDAFHNRLENFQALMEALKNHFAQGKHVKEFKPKFSEKKTLPDQNKVLRKVVEYLVENHRDLLTGPGVFDLKNLFKSDKTKSLEPAKAPPSTDESAVAELLKSQPSLQNDGAAALVLHQTIQRINKGEGLKGILKNLKESREIVLRLAFFMAHNEGLKKEDGTWDFSSLYSGKKKFPSKEEFARSLPLDKQIGPLVKGIQKSLQEEAGPGGGIESATNTEQRVIDMMHQMSELAGDGLDLDQMQSHFEQADKKGSRPYSLAYLFQQVRNFLGRLNRTNGLANSRNDMGLSGLFGPGATHDEPEAAEPETDADEPTDDRTTAFREMVKALDLDEQEAQNAHQLLNSLQLRMEGGEHAGILLTNLVKKSPKHGPLVKKLLSFFGKNRTQFSSGIPGMPNLSSLTGMPFKAPGAASEPEAPASETSVREIVKEKSTPVQGDERTKLRKTIFEDFATENGLGEDERNLYADAFRQLQIQFTHGTIAEEGILSAFDRLIQNTTGTPLEGIFQVILSYFKEKGLVLPNGIPDFRGVSFPKRDGREPYFKSDGVPNLKKVKEDDVSADMPEPRAHAPESDELPEERNDGKFNPDLQDAVDFLKSAPAGNEVKKDKAKERLRRNIWDILVNEFGLDSEDQQNAAELLHFVQKEGLPQARSKVKGQPNLAVLLEDLVDLMKEKGLDEEDVRFIRLPEIQEPETDPADFEIDDLANAPAKGKHAPTLRREVDDDTILKTLDAAQRAQGKGLVDGMFEVADVVRGLEGKVSPDDAKNALLQALETSLIELRPEPKKPVSDTDIKFVPVAEDGVPLALGRILKMPTPKSAPAPKEEGDKKPRGRLPDELRNKPIDLRVFNALSQKANLTPQELLLLKKEVPGLDKKTYNQIGDAIKGATLSDGAKNALKRYLTVLVGYLRLQQKDPAASPEAVPAAETPREKDVWKKDPATENQLRKIRDTAQGLKELGVDPQVNLTPESKGEASDIINSLMALLNQQQKAQGAPAAPAAPAKAKPAPAPQQPAANDDRKKAKTLHDVALAWLTDRNLTSALVFRNTLAKQKPELVPLYTKIMDSVQRSLDAQNDDIDVSGL